jgi:WD40 repeat protein/serine/threonine protein kinase
MTPEKWNEVQEIFWAALERGPGECSKFLEEVCGNDNSLREEVKSLLANANVPESIFDDPIRETLRHLEVEEKTVGHYRVLSQIGAGGMGEVYLAEDKRLGRRVALKMLPPVVAQDENHVRRMQKEARAAAALNHPNIVTIYDIEQADSLNFIVMEFIEGQTLRERTGSPMPIHEVVSIGIQVASGLVAAHQAGVLHRDIKPENIMIGIEGDVKILDFGIAQLKDPRVPLMDSQFLTEAPTGDMQTSILAGTPGYVSPEQALGEPLDARTDIFSLGVLLFEMATGRKPFEGETPTEVRQKILQNEVPALARFRKVPADLERIIRKALMKNPEERYASAAELLTELREFSRETAEGMDATQRANRMLKEYRSIYAVDKRALIPLTKLYFIARYSDMERGDRGRELFRKSLGWGLVKTSSSGLLILLATAIAVAFFSINETWDETIMKDGHTRAVRQVAFSPNGKLLVSVGEDAKVIVWDFERRMPLAVFTEHTKVVTAVAFSPDGKLFATASEDQSVIIWDAGHLVKSTVLSQLPGKVLAVAFSPDGNLLASATQEPTNKGHVILWQVGQWNKISEQTMPFSDYLRLIFSHDGRQLFSSRGQIWDVGTGREIHSRIPGCNWIAASPDGKQFLTIDGGGDVHAIDLLHHRLTDYPKAHQDSGRSVAISPDGRLAATGADDIVLWDAISMTKLARFEASTIVWNVAFSPDGRWLVSTHGDSSILVWDVADRKLAANLNGHAGAVRGVAFSADGKFIASAGEDHSVIIWSTETGRKISVLPETSLRLTGVAFSPDGETIASSGFRGGLSIWNKADGKLASTPDPRRSSYCVAISPDGKWLATTDGVHDSRDGHAAVLFEPVVGPAQMYGVAFSPDGHWLVGASALGGVVALLDTTTWQLRDKIKVPDTTFITVSFSSDNKHFVTGEDEGSVRLWSIEPLQQVAVLGHHTSRIKSVAFSPDGKEVVSAGDDKTIRLWRVDGSGESREIGTHVKPVLSVAFAPDGKRIVSGEHDYSVRIYTRHHSLGGYRLD